MWPALGPSVLLPGFGPSLCPGCRAGRCAYWHSVLSSLWGRFWCCSRSLGSTVSSLLFDPSFSLSKAARGHIPSPSGTVSSEFPSASSQHLELWPSQHLLLHSSTYQCPVGLDALGLLLCRGWAPTRWDGEQNLLFVGQRGVCVPPLDPATLGR